MTTVVWKPGLTLSQDPHAIRDYAFDLADFLEGETLATATATGGNCTASITEQTTDSVKVRVSGVTSGATMTLHVVTSSGQEDDRSIAFLPIQM